MNTTDLKAALSRLILSPDWHVFVNYIKENDVTALIQELKEGDFTGPEGIKDLQMKQYRVRVMEEMLEMPAKIIDGMAEIESDPNDPFPQNIEDVKQMDVLESVNGGEN
jgi:hypothetical protein